MNTFAHKYGHTSINTYTITNVCQLNWVITNAEDKLHIVCLHCYLYYCIQVDNQRTTTRCKWTKRMTRWQNSEVRHLISLIDQLSREYTNWVDIIWTMQEVIFEIIQENRQFNYIANVTGLWWTDEEAFPKATCRRKKWSVDLETEHYWDVKES